MSFELHRHDARRVSELLPPESVDLIVTSPPYFALRSYRDGGEHYDGQVGSEATPAEFVDTLIACTADWLRVLRPGGSLWVNLGDSMDNKCLRGLPWRYALRCVDELGLILRAEVIWSKPNGLPESVTDRVRRSHEQWFHFTRQGRYFAAIDEVREAHERPDINGKLQRGHDRRSSAGANGGFGFTEDFVRDYNPLGKVPGSVWSIPSEPLDVPAELGVDHFAAFPSELPRRIILGWSPSAYCTGCGEARRAVVDKRLVNVWHDKPPIDSHHADSTSEHQHTFYGVKATFGSTAATITGYACACPTPDAPTRPAVVLDPFTGTGTVPAVAHLLGRHGIGVDLSSDYLRLAEWRCTSDQRLRSKVLERSGLPNPEPPKIEGQLGLFEEASL